MSYVHCLLCDSHTVTDTNLGIHSLLWAFALPAPTVPQTTWDLANHNPCPLVRLDNWTVLSSYLHFPLVGLPVSHIIPEISVLSANVPLVHIHPVYWEKSSSLPHQCGSLPFSPLVICPSGQLKNSFPLTFHFYNVEFHVAYISINISSTPH